MSTAFASSTAAGWSAIGSAPVWRFGRPYSDVKQGGGVRWVLGRNCSISPRQLAGFYASVCAVSLLIAAAFAFNGAPVVLAFAGLELLVLGVSLLVYARHAADADTLTLQGMNLDVEQTDGSSTRTARFRAEWVSVEPARDDGSLVEISGQGQRALIGRFLRPEMRAPFARELRTALRLARDAAPSARSQDHTV